MSTNEPRALAAALQSPAFVTRGGGLAMHVADRHVERFAPEQPANQPRPLRNLGFVDRLVSPWIESAQRSAGLRMFSQYISSPVAERPAPAPTSWVFPRPWYQDELDWMAAAREAATRGAMEEQSAPSMLTTRGTYVAPAQAAIALPSALHEFVAPSLSLARDFQGSSMARPDVQATAEAYSPLVPFAATQAADVMARAVAPLTAESKMSPGLRTVLTTMLDRATHSDAAPTRAAKSAPELVTPPAPRRDVPATVGDEPAMQVAESYAEQHAKLAELQRMARAAAEREMAARAQQQVAAQPAPASTTPATSSDAQLAEIRAAQAKAIEQRQAEMQRRLAEAGARRDEQESERAAAAAAERQRLEQKIAERLAASRQQEAVRLHEQSRDAAARDARSAAMAPPDARAATEATAPRENRVAIEIAAAVAALPPELATMVTAGISARPERAVQAIAELSDALRSVELIARNQAAGGTFEPTRGPRVVMPAGLGGLVSTVERTAPSGVQRMPMAAVAATPPAPAPARETRVPAMTFINAPAPTSALAAAASTMPAALSHVAWSDRWLARFAGAGPQALDALATAASPSVSPRMQVIASAAPPAVFVAPAFASDRTQEGGEVSFDAGGAQEAVPTLRGGPAPAQPVLRLDDNAETPDDMLAAIAISANRARSAAAAAAQPAAPTLPAIDPDRYQPRDTLADLVAHSAPSAPGAGLSAQLSSSPFAPALRHVLPMGAAPSFDVRALFGAGLSATYLAGLLSAQTSELATSAGLPTWASWGDAGPWISVAAELPTRTAMEFEPTYVAPERTQAVEDHQIIAEAEPLTTLRSALLSVDAQTLAATAPVELRAPAPAASTPLARSMVDSIALPMLASMDMDDAVGDATTYAAPGMIAERAQAWSVAQQRSSADLAFDFITPELVLAARVYGLGPADAAQAMRLAVAGPGQLGAMAGAVDRTFVQAMAIDAERRGERTRMVTAYPVDGSQPQADSEPTAAFAPSGTTFGVARRAPRGAFLWPSATTAALGMNAAAPDGEQSMSVAALELLAAQAVAELGTYTALSPDIAQAMGPAGASTSTTATGGDEDTLAAATSLVPTARREKFQSLYVALTQSPSGRTWSPAARAARALALAGRGDDTVTARERATVAWDVLPMVYGADAEESLSTGEAAARDVRRRDELRALDPTFVVGVEARPGLANLSARAGEALGSYVASPGAPAASSSSSSSSREVGAVLRAPTAAPELVQTGRPAGRTGGGEVEIPAWFEQAARKMFEQKSASMSDGISIAELTLVNTAPAPQVAASTRVAGGAPPVAVAPSVAAGAEKQAIDVEKLANDVYREVLVLMDIARARNGEPYL
jgi:hypothetical protein